MSKAKALFLLHLVLLSSCSNNHGEWIAMTDVHEEKEMLMDKYGMPKKNELFHGLVFWEQDQLIFEPPLVFHWSGDELHIWIPNNKESIKYTLKVETCNGLEIELNKLLSSMGETALMMTDDKYWAHVPIILGGIYYDIKYFPEDMYGSIILRNTEFDRVPWIAAAKTVVEVTKSCLSDLK